MDDRLAESFDVHGRAADEVEDVALELGRAARVLALDVGGVGLAHRWCAADRAGRADDEGLCAGGPLLLDDFLDLRDDLAGLVDAHRVADAHVEVVDEVLIVQGRALDCRAAEPDRVKDGRRRDAARASDGELDLADDRLLLLGRVLVGNGPARHLGRRAELLAVREIVELDDGAVDVVGQIAAVLTDSRDGLPDLVRRMADLVAVDDLDALLLHEVVRLGMRRERATASCLQVEDEEREMALLRDAAVELPQRAGRAVARIGEGLEPQKLLPRVDGIEGFLLHVDFAAYLEVRQLVRELLLDVVDDLRILGDVLALHDAVAARDGAHELTVLIAKRHGEAVNFLLDDELRGIELLLQFLDKGEDLFLAEDVLQREHRHIVLDEHAGRAARLPADDLRRRVLGDELRILRLDGLEPQHELVVLVVRDLGVIFVVVAVVVVADGLAELRQLFLDLLDGFRRIVLCHAESPPSYLIP